MKFAEGERARRGPEVCAFRGRFVETFDIIAQKGGDVNGGDARGLGFAGAGAPAGPARETRGRGHAAVGAGGKI